MQITIDVLDVGCNVIYPSATNSGMPGMMTNQKKEAFDTVEDGLARLSALAIDERDRIVALQQ